MKEEKTKKKEFVPSWGAIFVCLPPSLLILWFCYRAMDEILMSFLPLYFNAFISTLIYCFCLCLLLWGTMWFFRITSKRYMEIEETKKRKELEKQS